MNIYCLKCKAKTGSKQVSQVAPNRVSARCQVCDTKKSLFIKATRGGMLDPHDTVDDTTDPETTHARNQPANEPYISDLLDILEPYIHAYNTHLRKMFQELRRGDPWTVHGRTKERRNRLHSAQFLWITITNRSPPQAPAQNGDGIYQSLQNIGRKKAIKNGDKNVRLLLDGEMHLGAPIYSSYTGPGTRTDLPPIRNAKPVDPIDAISRIHDIEYGDIKRGAMTPNQKANAIRQADLKAIAGYERVKDAPANRPGHYRIASQGLKAKIRAEDLAGKVPLGIGKAIVRNGFDGYSGI